MTRSDYQHCPPCRAVFLVTEDRCPNCGAANEALPVPEVPSKELWYELRPDCDGKLDDLVFVGAEYVHIERMDRHYWWIGVTMKDGRKVHINIGAKRAAVEASAWEE